MWEDPEETDGPTSPGGARGSDEAPPMEAALVCMAVVEDGPKIAFACYDEERNEILLEACHASDDTEAVVERFLQIARPNLVLVGTKVVNNPSFLEMITKPPPVLPMDPETSTTGRGTQTPVRASPPEMTDAFGDASVDGTGSIPYQLLKTGAFEVRSCKALILQKLRVLSLLRHEAREHAVGYGDPNRSDRQFPLAGSREDEGFRPSSYHSLAAIIDFDSKVSIQALGALLSFLQRQVFSLAEDDTITVNRIVQAKSSFYMQINAATFHALHIFSTEHHPLIAKGPGHSKEGFSLFSLLDRTKSKGGRQLLREWMLKPLIDIRAIEERQDAVELFLQPSLETSAGVLFNLLSKVGSIDKILTRLQKCASRPLDFLVLTRTLGAALSISNILSNDILPRLERTQDQSHDFIRRIYQRCNAQAMAKLQEEITTIVDEEATSELKTSVVIRRGFHPGLDQMKYQYERLEDVLERVGAAIHHNHPELHLSAVFVPQVGFLVSLEKDMVLTRAIELPEDFTHIFNQDDEAFFKTSEMRELDHEIGDLHGLIKDTESMIVTDLEESLLDSETELRECFAGLSELDCILAFATCAIDFNYVRPTMLEASTNRIHIQNGRHPLQEIITEKEFVPNDVNINNNERVIVVTGPNYSGKSCYLRQVGVLVHMAHIGSFIPCTAAEVSIVDQICARISTEETCAVPQSSFQIDLTQMAAILLRCTSNSLVLVDEFGKGTSPASGIALLGAVIKKLAQVHCKVVCTTHLLELFSMKVIEDASSGIKARRMAIQLPEEEDDGAAPLFKLEDGVASSSAGLICAKKAGVNDSILTRAKTIIHSMRNQQTIAPLKEALPPEHKLSSEESQMLNFFFSLDHWQDATDEQIRRLIGKVARIEL